MNSTEFQAVLQKAVKGDRVALEQLLILYKPLIDHASMVNGKLDEDLRQASLLNMGKAIPQFGNLMD